LTAVHNFSKAEIKRIAVEKRNQGQFYDRNNEDLEGIFRGSIDRFCDIAYEFREYRTVLDVGSGEGLLLALLKMLGHQVFAVDLADHSRDPLYKQHGIRFQICNIEADSLPFESESLDALTCCQAFEHFTHSHLPPLLEMKRVLRSQGIIEIDVPNVVCFRNRSRMLRGKNITFDYKKHYLYEKPVAYKGREYYPNRHNREFTLAELELLLTEAGFKDIDARYLKSRRFREGWERFRTIGTALRDAIPPLRKSLIAFARK